VVKSAAVAQVGMAISNATRTKRTNLGMRNMNKRPLPIMGNDAFQQVSLKT